MKPGIMRLLRLREYTEAVGETMATERKRFEVLAQPSAAPRAIAAFNLFQTPAPIAARMARLLAPSLSPGAVVLEPSAGLGRLYQATREAGHAGPMVLVELSQDCCGELYAMTEGDRAATLKQGDFLNLALEPVDAVIMNPPFKQGRDIKHILRAFDLLKPGGLLVALCYDGPRQRAALHDRAELWEPLPAGSFKSEGTRAGAVLLTMHKA